MKRIATAFLLAIVVFAASADGDVAPSPPKLGKLDVPPNGMANCDICADIRIHLKPTGVGVLAEIEGKFDISCQKSYRFPTESEIGFPVSNWEDRSVSLQSFQVDVDGKASVATKEKSWQGDRFGMYRGVIWSIGNMPADKRNVTVRYSMLLKTYEYAIRKPEYQGKKWCSFVFPLSGANFSENIKSGTISVSYDTGLIADIRVPKKEPKKRKENEIVWDMIDGFQLIEDMQIHIEIKG